MFDFRVQESWDMEGNSLGTQLYDRPVWKRVYQGWILKGIAEALNLELQDDGASTEFDTQDFLKRELKILVDLILKARIAIGK